MVNGYTCHMYYSQPALHLKNGFLLNVLTNDLPPASSIQYALEIN